MIPQNFGDWTRISWYNGEPKWVEGHIEPNTDPEIVAYDWYRNSVIIKTGIKWERERGWDVTYYESS